MIRKNLKMEWANDLVVKVMKAIPFGNWQFEVTLLHGHSQVESDGTC